MTPYGGSARSLLAYNLCDGKKSQTDVAKGAKIDKAALSRLLVRWVEAGIVVRVGQDQLPLHVFPLSKDALKAIKE